ncbi:MAG: recombinase family protein [Oscillospiraceae bacterium]|nr:recombinase family protein [Oscillospiraceae bacterium]
MTIIEKLKSRGIIPKAVLYARFSSDNQREESIDAQLRAMHEYCRRNGIVVIREYCDRARSATTDERPEFLAMIDDSKKCDHDFVVVHKLDRFTRNRYDSAYYKRELKKNGITLLSVLEYMDDSPESIILESVLEGMNEYYSKNLSREVMKGLLESARKCQALGGRPPYGYKVNQATRRYEINEDEAGAVRLIYQRVCEGFGYSEIITELNNLGYKTRNNNPFGKNSLTEILRNEKYKGIYIFNRASSAAPDRTRNNHKDKPDDEIIRIPGGMPALVDEITFDRVTALIKTRSRSSPHARAKENYMLVGKIFCGICGASYCGNRSHNGRNKRLLVTYRCTKSKTHGNLRCTNRDVNRNYLESFVFNRIGELIFSKDRIPKLIAAYHSQQNQNTVETSSAQKRLYSKLEDVQKKIDNIVSVITQTGSPSLLESLEKLEEEKKSLTVQISLEESRNMKERLDEIEIVAAYRRAQELFESGSLPQRKQLLNLYLKRINVYPEYVQIHLHKIPSNLKNPSCEVAQPADNSGSELRFLIDNLQKENSVSHPNKGRTRENLVVVNHQ